MQLTLILVALATSVFADAIDSPAKAVEVAALRERDAAAFANVELKLSRNLPIGGSRAALVSWSRS
jgi:hypothetical protein